MSNKKIKDSFNDKVKLDMVNSSEVSEEERKRIFDRESSVDAIPNLDILTGHVLEILLYLETNSTKDLLKTNRSAVIMHLNNKYADTVPYSIITLLVDEKNREENVERLLKMFENLQKAKRGELSLDKAEKILTDDVNDRYIYSKYGSKDAFEKALAREVQSEKSKKGKENVESIRNTGKAVFNN
jgi:hypothetical protein